MIIKMNPELFKEKINTSVEMYQMGMPATLVIHAGCLCLNSYGSTIVLGEILDDEPSNVIIQSGYEYVCSLEGGDPLMSPDIADALRLTRTLASEVQIRLTNMGLASRMITASEAMNKEVTE